MIKMCDLPRYADADMEEIKKMKEAHTVLNQVTYEPKPLYHGYTCLLYTSGEYGVKEYGEPLFFPNAEQK